MPTAPRQFLTPPRWLATLVLVGFPLCVLHAQQPVGHGAVLSYWVGAGPSVPHGIIGYRTLAMGSLRAGYAMGFLPQRLLPFDGQWDYQVEVPLIVVKQQTLAVAPSVSPIGFRYTVRTHSAVRPFVGGFAGVLYATQRVPEIASRLNFTPQGEVGLSLGHDPRHALNCEIRYIHISNASLYKPNPGVNGVMFAIGRSFH